MSGLVLTGAQIDQTLWHFLGGQLHVHQVPLPLLSWYWAGTQDTTSFEAVRAERDRLIHDVNYWYSRAVNPDAHDRIMAGIEADARAGRVRTAQRAEWARLDEAEKQRKAELDRTVRDGA